MIRKKNTSFNRIKLKEEKNMYICGKCKREMRYLGGKELICENCNSRQELREIEINSGENNQNINIIMDYKDFKGFLKTIL